MQLSSTISKVFGVVFLRSNDGSRLFSKYFLKHFQPQTLRIQDGLLSSLETQKQFENGIWEKGKKIGQRLSRPSDSEIFQYSQFNIIMKSFNEVNLYVIGDYDENEIILSQVSNAIYESLNYITKEHLNLQALNQNMDSLMIIVDEISDEGIVITTDPQVIIGRATMKDTDGINFNQQQQTEGSFASVFASAKRQLAQQFSGQA